MEANITDYETQCMKSYNSCWEKTLYCSNSSITPFLPLLQVLLLSIYFALGLCLNSFIIFLVLAYEELHRREFVIVLIVVITDLLTVTCLFPVFIITRSTSLWVHLGPVGCSFFGFIQFFFISFRYIAMFLLSFDRFNMVFFPFTYPLRGTKVMIPLTAVVSILLLLLAVLPLFLQCYGYQFTNGYCTVISSCSRGCLANRFINDIVTYLLGAILPVIFYSLMFMKSKYLDRKNKAIGAVVSDAVAEESHRRARNTYLLLFVTLIGFSIPQVAGLLVKPFVMPQPYDNYIAFSVTLLYTVVILDPLVIMKHQDVRRCSLKTLQVLKKRVRELFPATAVHPGPRN